MREGRYRAGLGRRGLVAAEMVVVLVVGLGFVKRARCFNLRPLTSYAARLPGHKDEMTCFSDGESSIDMCVCSEEDKRGSIIGAGRRFLLYS